jgi:hypothetical protein
MKGESEKINKMGGKRKRKKRGAAELLRWRNYEGFVPPPHNPFPPHPNYVNLYLHMVPKYPMRKIHPSKNGEGLGRTFSLWQFFLNK